MNLYYEYYDFNIQSSLILSLRIAHYDELRIATAMVQHIRILLLSNPFQIFE